LGFAKLFQFRLQGGEVSSVQPNTEASLRLRRCDGADEFSAMNRFSLVEGCTVLQRQTSVDPVSARALAMGERPATSCLTGHYAEFQIVSVFKSEARADWLRRCEPCDGRARHRTHGLVVGFMSCVPPKGSMGVTSAAKLQNSWCVASNGVLYTKTAADVPASRRQLSWSLAVGEGDFIGVLVTNFGGLILFLNGTHELMIPDAGVRTDVNLHPVVEISNHIRSVRLVPRSSPPS
jgi:hypothetical protein